MGAQEQPRQPVHVLFAQKPRDDRKGQVHGLGQGSRDVVAIDAKAAARRSARAVAQPGGYGPRTIEQRRGKDALGGGHAGTLWPMPASALVARAASASSTGQPGMSLSHSISTGRAPLRASV